MWRGDFGGGLEVCEGGGSVAGEGRKREGASEGWEGGGDAGVCIAACSFLASRHPVLDVLANPRMSWSLSLKCESVPLGVFVSVRPPLRESVCRLRRSVSLHPQQVTPATAPASVCLKARLALGRASLCPWVDLTPRKQEAGRKEGAWREGSSLQAWN